MNFTVPPGATGFRDAGPDSLPRVDLRSLRAAWHCAARLAGGRVGEFVERTYPRTFHAATIIGRDGLYVALCHAHHPMVAFVPDLDVQPASAFMEPPRWASAFADAGFELLSPVVLLSTLDAVDTSQLSAAEWRQIRYWEPPTLGALLFNFWD